MAMTLNQLKVGNRYDFGRWMIVIGKITYSDGTTAHPSEVLPNNNLVLSYKGHNDQKLTFDVVSYEPKYMSEDSRSHTVATIEVDQEYALKRLQPVS